MQYWPRSDHKADRAQIDFAGFGHTLEIQRRCGATIENREPGVSYDEMALDINPCNRTCTG